MSDLFSAGISGMNAAQVGLATTEHNIANANTPGFNRQVTVQSALPAQNMGSGYVGTGVNVSTVQRMYDQFLSNQVTQQQSQSSQLDTQYSQIQQIDNMMSDPTSGVAPALQNFFNAVNTAAGSPNSMPARQTVLSTAQSLSSTFQTLSQQLSSINSGINTQITSSVATINGYAQQIATLNQSIVSAQALSSGNPPNDLMDQRDQLVAQLNQQIGTSVVKQGDGSYNVSIGSGQSLVVGSNAYGLSAVQSNSDPTQLEVAAGTGGAVFRIPQTSIQGGSLGGLLAFRSQSLVPTQNMLGLVAAGVAGTFNQQHQLGQDINGAMASSTNSFFSDPAVPVVNGNTANTGTAAVTASISNYSQLTGSNYSLTYDGKNYTVTRLSDNKVTTVAAAAVAGSGPAATIDLTNTDGIKINIPTGAKAGDSFIVQPTANAAAAMSVALTDPASIALAAPVMTNAPLTNTGTATISPGAVDSTYTVATVTPAITLAYNSTTNTLSGFPAGLPVTVTTNASPPVTTTFAAGLPVTYTSGASISFGGASFTISGAPANNDTFTIAQNTNGSSDNRNALLLASLQTKNTMQGGTANYVGVYSQLVSQVGNQTNNLKVTSTAQASLLKNTIATQQSVSGVNLDEEAANLLRYQQAYQAAGKAMQVASTLFDTLLSIAK